MYVQKKSPHLWTKGETHLYFNIMKDLDIKWMYEREVFTLIEVSMAAYKQEY